VLPGLATLPGSMLIAISSPYRKSGLLYEKWKQHYGKNTADVLVIQATSRMLNPTLDQGLVDAALEDDPQAARSEWLGEWRNDLASFIGVEMIEACTDRGVAVRPPRPGVRYVAFVDAASGVGQEAFAVGIAHRDREEIVLDLAHEVKPPFSPSHAIAEVCGLLKGYNVTSVTGDKYAPGFVSEGFAQHRIRYAYSERDRSQIYVEALPLLTSGRARLVENKRLALQFASLERRTSPGGKDRIDHGLNGHDDLCNAVAGSLVEVATKPQAMQISDEIMRQGGSIEAFWADGTLLRERNRTTTSNIPAAVANVFHFVKRWASASGGSRDARRRKRKFSPAEIDTLGLRRPCERLDGLALPLVAVLVHANIGCARRASRRFTTLQSPALIQWASVPASPKCSTDGEIPHELSERWRQRNSSL
jgi:hypothetical protein